MADLKLYTVPTMAVEMSNLFGIVYTPPQIDWRAYGMTPAS